MNAYDKYLAASNRTWREAYASRNGKVKLRYVPHFGLKQARKLARKERA